MLLICTASSGHNLVMARRLQGLAEDHGVATTLVDLVQVTLPLFSARTQAQGTPPALENLESLFHRADGFFFCAPEYNGSTPPVLTNALAWFSVEGKNFRALFGQKPVALGTHSGGNGEKVLMAMRLQFSHLGCHVVGRALTSNKAKPLENTSVEAVLEQLIALMQVSR